MTAQRACALISWRLVVWACVGFWLGAAALLAGCQTASREDQPQETPTAPTEPAMESITGSVTYRARMALPPSAELVVTLEDVSRADAPAAVVAQRTIPTEGRQPPIPFTLEFDPARIDERQRYNLRAAMSAEGRLLFTTAQAYPVLTDGAGRHVDMVLQLAGGERPAPQPPAALSGPTWRLVTIGGEPAIPGIGGRPASMTFNDGGELAAFTSINGMGGRYEAKGAALRLTPGPMTMMAGPPELMRQERAFLDALSRVDGYRIEGPTLQLLSGGHAVMVFERSDG